MRRLLYLEPNALGVWDHRVKRVLDRAASPGTTIDVAHLEGLPDDMVGVFLPKKPFYYSELFRAVQKAEDQGYDAVMVGCSADPGVREAAHMSSIPVVGPFKAALHLAGFLGGRLAVISPGHGGGRRRPVSWHYDSARLYGLSDHVACFRVATVERPDEEYLTELALKDREAMLQVMEESFNASILKDVRRQAELAVQEDNATAVYLGCTIWGGRAEPLARVLSVPVIDPIAACVNVAEALSGVRQFVTGRR